MTHTYSVCCLNQNGASTPEHSMSDTVPLFQMENPYLTTPALLGLSQHTAGFSEALRMSRTFAPQVGQLVIGSW